MTDCKRAVINFYADNPFSRQSDCVRATGISATTVSRYWPGPVRWGIAQDIVDEFCEKHPNASQSECHSSTGLSKGIISRCWRHKKPKEDECL